LNFISARIKLELGKNRKKGGIVKASTIISSFFTLLILIGATLKAENEFGEGVNPTIFIKSAPATSGTTDEASSGTESETADTDKVGSLKLGIVHLPEVHR
jgi:hypothetical protein